MYKNLVEKVLSKYWRNKFSQIFQERNLEDGIHIFHTSSDNGCYRHMITIMFGEYGSMYYKTSSKTIEEVRVQRTSWDSYDISDNRKLYYKKLIIKPL